VNRNSPPKCAARSPGRPPPRFTVDADPLEHFITGHVTVAIVVRLEEQRFRGRRAYSIPAAKESFGGGVRIRTKTHDCRTAQSMSWRQADILD
jgi:hypothetical protein